VWILYKEAAMDVPEQGVRPMGAVHNIGTDELLQTLLQSTDGEIVCVELTPCDGGTPIHVVGRNSYSAPVPHLCEVDCGHIYGYNQYAVTRFF
jgi:hypothetical protein